MNAVTCATWLKRGTLSSKPKKHISTVKAIKSLVFNTEQDDSNDKNEMNKFINDYDLDDYSSDDDTASCLQNMATFLENKNDPYMKENDNSSSEEDDIIDKSDGIIVVGKTHKDYHSLEVWVVNKDEDNHINSYCHHDYILTACPLDIQCFSNMNVNLAAVSSISPIIQLWDLDAMNVVDPVLTLGNTEEESQTDAVLTLSNKFLSQNSSVLLSGSAEGTVVLWSIKEGGGSCVQKSSLGHSDKIQSVQWHPIEDSIFATGSFDETVHVYDCRTCFQRKKKPERKWIVNGEVEKIVWDVHQPFNLFSASSLGTVHYFDIRTKQPVWVLNAHNPASTSGIAQSNFNDRCIVTTSDEGKVKIWDTKNNRPELVSTKFYKIGSIFCITPAPEEPMNFCVGGEREMKIIDLNKDTKIKEYFLNVNNGESNNILSGDSLINNLNKIEGSTSISNKNILEFEQLIDVNKRQVDTHANLNPRNLKHFVENKKNKKRKKDKLHKAIELESVNIKKVKKLSDNNIERASTIKNKKNMKIKNKSKKNRAKINDAH